jgi:hypothetical protein
MGSDVSDRQDNKNQKYYNLLDFLDQAPVLILKIKINILKQEYCVLIKIIT